MKKSGLLPMRKIVYVTPQTVRAFVDLKFLAEQRPKFTIKDLVVFAGAIGARVHQHRSPGVATFAIEFEIPVSEVVLKPIRGRKVRR